MCDKIIYASRVRGVRLSFHTEEHEDRVLLIDRVCRRWQHVWKF